MKKILFIDRDGTLIVEPPEAPQIDNLEKLRFIPGVFTWLGKIARETDYELVMVSNQDGLGTDRFPENTFWPVQKMILNTLENEDIHFSKIHIDRSLPEENKPTRKPGIGMLTEYLNGQYDLKNSFVIGDRITDIQLAKNLGAKGILFSGIQSLEKIAEQKLTEYCVLNTHSWKEVYKFLRPARLAETRRTTKETDIFVSTNLDGSGLAKIHTGLGFFDHMLEQIARHGQIDLEVAATGDLHIDEHHTVEDTALVLGETILKALGDKRGMERFGFCLPMDDCLAQVAIDFGGRPWLVWEVEFKREKIGEVPTELFFHFFKSFSDSARCNLNIKAEGTNEHHKIEAIFKAFAKAVRFAVKKEGHQLPSTKGTL
ncbi:MAG: Histidinol-phosphatase / Imidazoleglycerol-phosphate dehydratase [Cytophagales bacterium]|jgi:imidazoleglycerol-phosphate dehydratase/histidinol-phosphatase|nr:bifunctional histidinol-phosphatase/imidazoleglycerol-phosphate dehydratase HisB [Bacteroidota bacterium]MBS1979584.1 bifunctional histidinol-phosphatase/imidazoleglycerol-phosphate dehydratase HisB [Bacteroidota bacterium]WHZ09215.1 MAG: Histidinol-phosphatase / Imidazoleglycerol-phosphate dehydratase [Cytophagales bacterium]